MSKSVLFVANSLDNAFKFQQVLSNLDVETTAASTLQIKKLLAPGGCFDLVIFEARATAQAYLEEVESLVDGRGYPFLLIVEEADVADIRFPSLVPSDFVLHGAGTEECAARVRRLLGVTQAVEQPSVLSVDDMTINLSTYQVSVGDKPVDFTYLEYALLAFLVQHPDHTFTRDILLQNVWGFDYYGGSRTVDVHVRRIRSKLGPVLAEHLETIRGVGYLWKKA